LYGFGGLLVVLGTGAVVVVLAGEVLLRVEIAEREKLSKSG
jgi:hypothetical protein